MKKHMIRYLLLFMLNEVRHLCTSQRLKLTLQSNIPWFREMKSLEAGRFAASALSNEGPIISCMLYST